MRVVVDSYVLRFFRLYLTADCAQHTVDYTVVSYIILFADFFKLFFREAAWFANLELKKSGICR